MEPADTADFHRVPYLVELCFIRLTGWLHHQPLEAVLLAVLAGVSARDPLGALT